MKVAWCSTEAAKYAVVNWHYSKSMPASKLMKLGVWEQEKFYGAILYGRGATINLCKPFGLHLTQVVELVRVAFRKDHKFQVTRAIAVSLKLLKKSAPGIELVVSYADTGQGHKGGIYQGGNWLYVGSKSYTYISINGKTLHPRTVTNRYGTCSIPILQKLLKTQDIKPVKTPEKHKYIMPLTPQCRQRVANMAKPYPK